MFKFNKKISALVLIVMALISTMIVSCGGGSSNNSDSVPDVTTVEDPLVPAITFSKVYSCKKTLSLLDSCLPGYLHQTKDSIYMKVSKLISNKPISSLYMYANGNFDGFTVIDDLNTSRSLLFDNITNKIILYDGDGGGKHNFDLYDVNKSTIPATVTSKRITIPGDAMARFRPLLAYDNVLYGKGINWGETGPYFYKIDYKNEANIVVTRISGLHDGTSTVANWTEPIGENIGYGISWIKIVGDIIYYKPAPAELSLYPTDSSYIYWVNLYDNSIGGYFRPEVYSINSTVVYNNNLYFSYNSNTYAKWFKASIQGSGSSAQASLIQMSDWSGEHINLIPTNTKIFSSVNIDYITYIHEFNTDTFTSGTTAYRIAYADSTRFNTQWYVIGSEIYTLMHTYSNDGDESGVYKITLGERPQSEL